MLKVRLILISIIALALINAVTPHKTNKTDETKALRLKTSLIESERQYNECMAQEYCRNFQEQYEEDEDIIAEDKLREY